MSQRKAREARQTIPTGERQLARTVDHAVRDKRAADTLNRRQTLELERADLKAEGKLSPARHLLTRLNYKKVAK